MTQAAINYGRVLYELSVSEEAVEEAECVFENTPQLLNVLKDPLILEKSKENILKQIFGNDRFPASLSRFLLVVLRHKRTAYITDMFCAYREYAQKEQGILEAELHYVTAPSPEQLEQLKQVLMKRYQKNGVRFIMVQDPGLVGGFLVRMGNLEIDWSMRGRLKQLEQVLIRR